MFRSQKDSRRNFVKKIAGGTMAAGVIPIFTCQGGKKPIELAVAASFEEKSYSPNDTIRLGAIGMGIQGFQNCNSALKLPGVELVAVCDLYEGHLEHAKEVYGDQIATMQIYEELLDRDDIDAVIISTPDHWHDHMAIAALNKGKHVYLEKPMVHRLEEGVAVIEAQKASGKILQVGSQRVSSIVYQKAKEIFESGDLGSLILAEIWYDRQSALGAWQYSIPPDASEKTIAWNRYLGDAPKVDFDPVRFFRWRNYQDYGTGIPGDLFVHLFSGLHLIVSSHGPQRIYATGGLRYWKDGRDVPDIILGTFDYPETAKHPAFNVQMRVNFSDGGGGGSKVRLVGTEGVMEIQWGGIKVVYSRMPNAPGYGGWDSFGTFTEAMQEKFVAEYNAKYPPKAEMIDPDVLEYKVPEGYNDHLEHHRNFIEAIRHNKPVIEDASFGLRAAGPALATNVSYFENRIVDWDPDGMKLI